MLTLKTGKTKTEEKTGGGTIWENKSLLACSVLKKNLNIIRYLDFIDE